MEARNLPFQISDQLPDFVVSAVEETIRSILEIEVKVKSITRDGSTLQNRDISGVMGFIQNNVEGTLALSFTDSTAFAFLGKFYGHELDRVSEEVTEGVAELTNMIHALVKDCLNQQGFNFQMCLPFVVIGNQHQVFSTKLKNRVLVEFESNLGPFWAEVVVFQN